MSMIERDQEPIPEVHAGPFVSASAPAIGRTENEDMAGIVENHTGWVLDGADDPLANATKCAHGATWYVRTLHQALTQFLSEDQPALDLLLQKAIQHTRDVHEAECRNPAHRKTCATVAIVRCCPESIDYLVLGDASILLESSEAVVHVTDRRMHRVARSTRREILARLEQGHGYGDSRRHALLRTLVEQEQRARSSETGYSIAADDPEAAFDSIAESLPFNTTEPPIDRAALLTDGAERAVSTFGLFRDWREFMRAVSSEGPAACIKKIREAELLDHSGHQYPRTKHSDDASIIVLGNCSRPWEGHAAPSD